jgi:hypothetical protein
MNEGPKRTQIALRSFLISSSLIGAGIGCFLAGRSHSSPPESGDNWRAILALLQVLGSAPLVGGGILWPFGRPILGACLGFFLFLIVGVGYDAYHFGWKASRFPAFAGLTLFVISTATTTVVRGIWRRLQKRPVEDGRNSD